MKSTIVVASSSVLFEAIKWAPRKSQCWHIVYDQDNNECQANKQKPRASPKWH